jgi:L-amino acid N-acyltransferase YncA
MLIRTMKKAITPYSFAQISKGGLGWQLMQTMIQHARWLGLQEIEGLVLHENSTMLTMCKELGFVISSRRTPACASSRCG